MSEPTRILYISSEVTPYLPETTISKIGRHLPQGAQEGGSEIRLFMPRYGVINERRNQLHEVIRLSGMNIIVNEVDRPLTIKVSSISSARMQVYFIDNDDYFQRKFVYTDDKETFFKDNDERAILFARGVLETVKKLRWSPDIIHCQGWISHFVPLYLKHMYSDDPIFAESKLVLSLFNEFLDEKFASDTLKKLAVPGVAMKGVKLPEKLDGVGLAKVAIENSHAVIVGEEKLDSRLVESIEKAKLPTLDYIDTSGEELEYIDQYINFYNQIIEK